MQNAHKCHCRKDRCLHNFLLADNIRNIPNLTEKDKISHENGEGEEASTTLVILVAFFSTVSVS